MSSGMTAALKAAVKHIAKLEKAPAVAFFSKARAVPIPWAVIPKQRPHILGSVIFNSLKTNGERPIESTAVSDTAPAANVVSPPISSASEMAIGVVTDFGASDSMVISDAPNSPAIAIAEPAANNAPVLTVNKMGNAILRIRCSC